jgi:hypothetical protein
LPDARTQQIIGNGILFNLSWLLIVGSASAILAPLVAIGHVALHQLWIGRGGRELALIGGVAVFGLLLDQLLFAVGLFTVNGQHALAPLWLSCLWPVLATTLGHAFSGLQQRPLLAAVLGAIGGFTSYTAGTAMTDIGFAHPLAGPIAIAAIWACLFPALALVARRTLEPCADEPSLA